VGTMERNLKHSLFNRRNGAEPARSSSVCRWRQALAGITLAGLAAVAIAVGPQKMYKWVDDKGVVHYTDTLPPDAVDKGNVELNKQGVAIGKTDPNATPEQRRAREAEIERAKQEAKDEQEKARLDRALLDSYTSEQDIELAKSRALKTIEQSVESARAYIAQLNKRKEAMATAKLPPNDKNAAAVNERELARINSDLEQQGEFLNRKQTEMANLIASYDSDKERWRAARARDSKRSVEAANTKSGGAAATKAQK
jgi:hypothetical protein